MSSKITELVHKINFLTGQSAFPDLSKLEIDLLMQHLRELYEELDARRKITPISHKSGDYTTIIQKSDEINLTDKLHKEPLQSERSDNDKKTPLEVSTQKEFSSSEQKEKDVSSVGYINDKIQPETSLNDKLKNNAVDVNRKLAAGSLKDLLDLNKKFAVLNELFKGDGTAFHQSISDIDNAESLEHAEAYIHSNLVTRFNWDLRSQTCKMFLKLVAQRFE